MHGFEGNNVLVIGAPRENMGKELNVGPILTAKQAYLIDKKWTMVVQLQEKSGVLIRKVVRNHAL